MGEEWTETWEGASKVKHLYIFVNQVIPFIIL